MDAPALRRELAGRAYKLGATLDIDTVPDWGSRTTIDLPLSPAAEHSEKNKLAELNRREMDVLRLVTQGKRNKAIGADLGVSESTVKFHVASLLKELNVITRGEAAALATNAGIEATAT